MTKSNKSSFLKGASILVAAGIIIKIIGAAFKLPLGNKLGGVGMSYFTAPYPLYNFLIVVSTAGIATAVARLIAEKETENDYNGIIHIVKVMIKPVITISIIIFLILSLLSIPISNVIKIPNSRYAFFAISPALLFVPIMSVYRGYFQGIQRMEGFAITQILEQLFRVIVGLSLAFYLYKYGLKFSAAGATFGATAGSIVGVITSLVMYKIITKKKFKGFEYKNIYTKEEDRKVIKSVFLIAMPMTLGAAIVPIMNSVDVFLVNNRLIYAGVENAEKLYGILTGFTVTIVNFPQIITASLQISLVPAITQLYTKYIKDKTDINKIKLSITVNAGLKVAYIFGLASAIGLFVLSDQIMNLLFPSQPLDALKAAEILRYFAWDLIFLALYQASTAVLYSIKKQHIPPINLAIGLLVKVVLTYTLVASDKFLVNGAAVATVGAFLTASILNIIVLKKEKYLDIKILKIIIRPTISAVIMGVFVKYSFDFFNQIIKLSSNKSTLITILLAIIVYFITLILTKSLTKNEIEMIPKLNKVKFIKRLIK